MTLWNVRECRSLGSAGASPAVFGAPPKTRFACKECPARRVTQRARRPRSPEVFPARVVRLRLVPFVNR